MLTLTLALLTRPFSACRLKPIQGFAFTAAIVLLIGGCEPTQTEIDPTTQTVLTLKEPDRTCLDYNPQKNPYFGDTHVHTVFSLDAYTQDTRVTPRDAYRFAKGHELDLAPYDEHGNALLTARLERPLDFVLISDHAEFLGDRSLCTNPQTTAYDTPTCVLYRSKNFITNLAFNLLQSQAQSNAPIRMPHCGPNGEFCRQHAITLWQQTQLMAEEAYDRSEECAFTSFIGYEWSASPSKNLITYQNLHRNVLFANAQVPELPIGYLTEAYPEGLWQRLEEECLNADFDGVESCDVLAIPHNSNLSNGMMFEQVDRNGDPLTQAAIEKRLALEPIAEIIQHKGVSECIAGGSDEACAFDAVPWGHLAGNVLEGIFPNVAPKSESFLRHALKQGLSLQQNTGGNPFKYGFIGSTDTHIGAPGLVKEEGYPGHGGAGNLGQVAATDITVFNDNIEHNPGGLAVVWAEQNTRRDLFAAMKRKEVYATSGPRHILRFFGGDRYPEDLCDNPEALTETGYDQGVPMGGDLVVAEGRHPHFVVSVLKDAGTASTPGVDLQQVQIIKGWLDQNNQLHEQVLTVAGDPDNPAGVDLSSCQPTGSGYAQLCTVWEDQHFNPKQQAFYYARVLENPSCRWHTYQCLKAQVDCSQPTTVPEGLQACCNDNVSKVHQERSWSSPIWYTPAEAES